MNFIEEIVSEYINSGKGPVKFRFPPEPNGYLHIGHAKSICLNFGLAEKFNGTCNLRFDDTNPSTEDSKYVEAIMDDIAWLGFKPDAIKFTSDYFDTLYAIAKILITNNKAYVCDLTEEEMSEYRTVPTSPDKPSPYRERSIEENLDLFDRMKNGEFEDGSKTLRAKIDLASPNMHMRDPILYRIKKENHHRTGDTWCVYPMYDFGHCLSDYEEEITHSVCTLEFSVHRPLYDWIIENTIGYVNISKKRHTNPKQYEFARLNLDYTVLSKRFLLKMVNEGIVSGWDDPRMPTISGLRRRGYTPEAIRNFCENVGVTKFNSNTDVALLEHNIREDLNKKAIRVMAVLNPVKLVITNYPEDLIEEMDAINNPEDESAGTRKVPFSKELYIERDDFMEDAPKKFFRLSPGKEVRLRYAYYITCTNVVKDESGEIVEIHCTYDPETKGGSSPDGRRVKGTIHWVSAEHAIEADINLYDRLFSEKEPLNEERDFMDSLNPDSLSVLKGCRLEPSLKNANPEINYQFERKGYFILDKTSSDEKLVFNRTISLRDTWAKVSKK